MEVGKIVKVVKRVYLFQRTIMTRQNVCHAQKVGVPKELRDPQNAQSARRASMQILRLQLGHVLLVQPVTCRHGKMVPINSLTFVKLWIKKNTDPIRTARERKIAKQDTTVMG